MSYLPIEDYGIIGDLHSIALVGVDGSIDWCCLPHFDSPSVFGALLDDEIGGRFRISAQNIVKRRQSYLPDTNILVTRSYTDSGLGQVENFMALPAGAVRGAKSLHRIVRRISCVRGTVSYTIDCAPALDYARLRPEIRLEGSRAMFGTFGGHLFFLQSPVQLAPYDSGVSATISLQAGESATFVFVCCDEDYSQDLDELVGVDQQLFDDVERYWQHWISRCTYAGRWSDMVSRSALVLKLLTFEPTGAIVAAPTMGLPEQIGGERNWDYRYTWIRDASFTVYALMRIGFTAEAERFMEWVTNRLEAMDERAYSPIQLMYRIDGSLSLNEEILGHLSGYRNSRPVRVGNAAHDQLQLDIYGELMDSIYLFNKYGKPISHRQWSQVRKLMGWLCKNWNQVDEGIWETRAGRQHFVFSKLMCWVALDRAARMSAKYSLPGDTARWTVVRDKIYDQIMKDGWNETRGTFRQHYRTDALDAANLLMPLVKFISPVDPRIIGTLDATISSLMTDSLVFRYDAKSSPDGLAGEEGTFCICTFWLVECLTRAGRLEEARLIFQKMLGYANHVGLYGEEIGLHGETLGNFPQAFTHLGLISAAYNLDAALSKGRKEVRGTDDPGA